MDTIRPVQDIGKQFASWGNGWVTMAFKEGHAPSAHDAQSKLLALDPWIFSHLPEALIMTSAFPRRDFTRSALVAAATAAMPAVARAGRVIGANDCVRIGCIGMGYRGVQVLFAFTAHKDAEIASRCDVYEPYLHGRFDQIHPHFKRLNERV